MEDSEKLSYTGTVMFIHIQVISGVKYFDSHVATAAYFHTKYFISKM